MASDTDTVTDGTSSADIDYDDMSDVVELANRLLTTFRVAFSLVTIIVFVGLVANGFVLYAILRSKKLRNTVYNVYIVSLSVSNFIFLLVWGLTDIVIYGIYLHKQVFHVVRDSNIRKLIEACESSTMVINCFMITALAVDRYAIVAHPQAVHNTRTVKNALIGCGIVWAVGLLSSCVVIPIDLFTTLETLYTINIILFIFTFAIPFIIIVVCFGLTIRAAGSKRNATTLSPTRQRSLARKTRFLVLIGGVSLSFFITWGYWHGYYLAIWPHVLNGEFYHRNVVLHICLNMLTDILVLFNAALNPFLYTLNQPHMKRYLASLLPCGRKSGQHASEMNNGGISDGTTESVSVTPNGGGVAFNVAEESLADNVPKSTSGI